MTHGADPSSGVDPCRTTVAVTRVPSGEGNECFSPTYDAGSKPGASLRSSSVRSPVTSDSDDQTCGSR